MENINELKNYRLKYKRYYGIDFDKNYVVHHIDENRSNNDISNLVLMPLELHSKYHAYKTEFKLVTQNGMCFELSYAGSVLLNMQLSCLDKLAKVCAEIQLWVEYKYNADMGYEVYPMFRRLNNGSNKNK